LAAVWKCVIQNWRSGETSIVTFRPQKSRNRVRNSDRWQSQEPTEKMQVWNRLWATWRKPLILLGRSDNGPGVVYETNGSLYFTWYQTQQTYLVHIQRKQLLSLIESELISLSVIYSLECACLLGSTEHKTCFVIDEPCGMAWRQNIFLERVR
jgi:hypothetical protein